MARKADTFAVWGSPPKTLTKGLSASQIAAVNASAGAKIDTVLSSRGWYLQIKDPGATVRAARGTPIITLYYMDGGSIQTITMASILVQ